jgi:uncharacterized membrane protein (DUF485 family)
MALQILHQVDTLKMQPEGERIGRNKQRALSMTIILITLCFGWLIISNLKLTGKSIVSTSVNFPLAFGLLAILMISTIVLGKKK